MPNMTCFLFSHARDLHGKFKARPGKNTGPKRCPFCPFCPISPRKTPINFILLAVVEIHKGNNAEAFITADPTEVKCPENTIRKRKTINQ